MIDGNQRRKTLEAVGMWRLEGRQYSSIFKPYERDNRRVVEDLEKTFGWIMTAFADEDYFCDGPDNIYQTPCSGAAGHQTEVLESTTSIRSLFTT